MFNGKFPFPPSREAWGISLLGISRFPEIPEVREFPAHFPGNGNFPPEASH